MKLASLPFPELQQRLRHEGVDLFMPPYKVRLHSHLRSVAEELHRLYADFSLLNEPGARDFHIRLFDPSLLRRLFKRQVQFALDEFLPFKPLPFDQAHAMLEWGLNWCIGNRDQTHLIMHAGVVALGNHALVMPAESGSGKSTLSAALSREGFRLLSDELCLWQLGTRTVTPVPRPISLKNQSITLMQQRYPDAVFSRTALDTRKGTVAHMRPDSASIEAAQQAATARLIVLPRYQAGSEIVWQRVKPEDALTFCISQSFNYSVLGEAAFDTMLTVLQQTPVYSLRYSSLDDIIPFLKSQLQHEIDACS